MKLKLLQKLKSALLLVGLCISGTLVQGQTYTFTNAGATGTSGPTQTMVTNAYSSTSLAGSVTATGGIQTWSVPVGGLYKIEVYGANGYGPFAGRGAYMSGEFNFNASDVLKILVGQQGGCCVLAGTQQFGGGGGSFVVDATNTPLIVAGGGGGVNGAASIPVQSDANITTNGNAGVGTTAGSTAGTNGGGGGGVANAGGGGGFTGNGGVLAGDPGGFSFLNGGAGGTAATAGGGGWGGFGGGGGANSWDNRRGGGGGGYSGGGGAGSATTGSQEGGGGGSYNTGANQLNTPALGTGHGFVVITLLVPAIMVANNTGAAGFPSLTSALCPGNQSVSVKVRNYGNNFVSSVKIGWQVNGVIQNDIVYPVALNPYPGPAYETTVTVGAYNFGPGSNVVKAWTSLPNNQQDAVTTNDTSTISVPVSLTGTYTLNSALATAGTNYQSFTDFANDLTNKGICGSVVLDVISGSGPYNEQIIIPQVTGSSAANTITINGNGCTIGFASANANQRAVITLNGTDYITIDSLIINANTGTYGWGVLLTNGADNNVISSCTINTSLINTTAYNYVGIALSGSGSTPLTAGNSGNNNLITNNVLVGGYYGVSLYGNSTANGQCVNNIVTNNIIQETYSYGCYTAYQSGAIYSNNDFSRPTRTSSTTTAGILLTTGCINTLVERNKVHNMFDAMTTNTSAIYGFYDGAAGTAAAPNKFINNVVYNINGNGIVYGIYNTSGAYMQAYHNTISLDYTPATLGATYGMYQTAAVAGIDYRNNIITIARGGSGLKFGFYFNTAASTHTSNNNDVYLNSTGTGLQYYGYYAAVNYATLANWQTANGGIYDGLSQNMDPLYFNPAGGDFTPTNPGIDNLGVYVNVNTDIMGNPRSFSTPDMGAWETATAPCTTPPAAGSATANPSSGICGGANILVNLTGATYGSGQTYQWEESATIGGPYFPVSGSLVSPATTVTATNTAYYRAAVTCNSITSYSTPVLVTVGAVGGTASTPTATICVGGTATLALTGHAGNNIQWESFDIGTSSWIPIPGATTATSNVSSITASTSIRAAVSCNSPFGTVYSNTFNIIVTNPQIVQTFPGSRCNAGPVTLAATGTPGSVIHWYAGATGGSLLSTGGAFTTPSLSSTTDFYAAASSGGQTQTSAMPPTLPNVSTLTYAGLVIDVNQALVLNSVNVFSINGGSVSVELRNSAGVILAGPVSFPLVASTYTTPQNLQLNFAIPPGTGYRLLATPGLALAYQGGSYPLPLGNNVGNVVNGAVGATTSTSTLNYYFYNLQTTTGCESPRVAVTATINGIASGSGLSTGGTTIINSHPASSTVNYIDACNDKVATVSNNPTALGNTAAIVLTSPTVQTFGNKPYVPRAFDVTPATNGSATVTLYALQSDFNAYNSYVTSNSLGLPLLPTTPADPNAANVRITQFHGSALAGTSGPLGLYNAQNSSFITNVTTTWTGQYWSMTFNVTGFSGFFIHTGATPLVIDLRDISAVNVGSRNRIDWSTVNEESGDRFELERSADSKNFSKLAGINAKGSANSYSYWDEIPFDGTNYYRLKLVHTSGSTSYSKVVSVTVRGTGAFSLEAYPNPVSDMLTVKAIGSAGANASLVITDLSGKVLKRVTVTGNNTQINMAGLAQGVYFVKYSDSKQSQTIKVNKQ